MGKMTSAIDLVAAQIEREQLLGPGERVTCLVSGGADSTCLWHVLRELGYDVRAVHVHHGVRGVAADRDASHCRELLGATIVHIEPATTEAELA